MDQIQALIKANAQVLLPVFRTTCAILGLTMLWVGSAALSQPIAFADNFGLPLRESGPSGDDKHPSSKEKSSVNSGGSQETGTAWLIVFAGRELALGSAILLLLYLDELRALSVVLLAMYLVVAGDTVAALWYGKQGSVRNHLIPGVFMALVGPVGLLLHPKT